MNPPTKADFLLDPTIVFLNHGSFGACPREVFEVYQTWQRRLENQPVQFLGREMADHERQARQVLATYLNTAPENLVFVLNATYGVNIVAHSLALKPGDEILTSDHEYGSCNNAWEYACTKTGAAYKYQPVPLPVRSEAEMVETFWQGVNDRTRVIYLSHITSPSALRLPIEAICARARAAGILTVIDGAHAPGQLALDLEAVGADFYTGNCHKWMLGPKSAGFLYARPEVQDLVEPLVVSFGYKSGIQPGSTRFLSLLTYIGTRDPAAYLTVPDAIQYMQAHDWPSVRAGCHQLLRQAIERISALSALEPPYPLDSGLYSQMGIAPLPANIDLNALKTRLYDEYRVEIPLTRQNGSKFARISVQVYNTPEDLDTLVEGIERLLPQVRC
jgi:isopenicillin-N epimerase